MTPKSRPELWVGAAFALSLATATLFLYLGLRPGGIGPIVAYTHGRLWLFLAGTVVLLFGLVRSALRRPILQRGRGIAFLGLGLSLFFCSYPLAYPSSHEKHPSATRFRLPFDGEWIVRWGGSRGAQNPLVLLPDRRFGFDFVQGDAAGRSQAGERYLCDGAPVLAPAAGEVVRVFAGDPAYGVLVVLRTAESEYVFLAGLGGAPTATVGQEVALGAELGRVASSSFSPVTPQPHLAVWAQDTPDVRRGEGIPMLFHGYVQGDRAVERGIPTGGLGAGGVHAGQRVRPAVPADD